MGNCLRHDSKTGWTGAYADDDWIDLTSQVPQSSTRPSGEKMRLLGEIRSSSAAAAVCSVSDSGSGDQVRIKITKKELEVLVHGGNVHGMEQLLARLLINGHDQYYYDHHDEMDDHRRPWRPVLQSIPEVN